MHLAAAFLSNAGKGDKRNMYVLGSIPDLVLVEEEKYRTFRQLHCKSFTCHCIRILSFFLLATVNLEILAFACKKDLIEASFTPFS